MDGLLACWKSGIDPIVIKDTFVRLKRRCLLEDHTCECITYIVGAKKFNRLQWYKKLLTLLSE